MVGEAQQCSKEENRDVDPARRASNRTVCAIAPRVDVNAAIKSWSNTRIGHLVDVQDSALCSGLVVLHAESTCDANTILVTDGSEHLAQEIRL